MLCHSSLLLDRIFFIFQNWRHGRRIKSVARRHRKWQTSGAANHNYWLTCGYRGSTTVAYYQPGTGETGEYKLIHNLFGEILLQIVPFIQYNQSFQLDNQLFAGHRTVFVRSQRFTHADTVRIWETIERTGMPTLFTIE